MKKLFIAACILIAAALSAPQSVSAQSSRTPATITVDGKTYNVNKSTKSYKDVVGQYQAYQTALTTAHNTVAASQGKEGHESFCIAWFQYQAFKDTYCNAVPASVLAKYYQNLYEVAVAKLNSNYVPTDGAVASRNKEVNNLKALWDKYKAQQDPNDYGSPSHTKNFKFSDIIWDKDGKDFKWVNPAEAPKAKKNVA